MKWILPIFILITPTTAFGITFDNGFDYCYPITLTAGGTSGGVGTTTTAGFPIVATTTNSELAHTDHGGVIKTLDNPQQPTSTPLDLIITDGTDCQSDEGTVIDFKVESYASTTGDVAVHFEHFDIASTSPTGGQNKALMFVGLSGASDQSDKASVYGSGLSEYNVWTLHESVDEASEQFRDWVGTDHADNDFGGLTTSDSLLATNLGSGLEFDGGSSDFIKMDSSRFTGSFTTRAYSFWVAPAGDNDRLGTLWEEGGNGNGLAFGYDAETSEYVMGAVNSTNYFEASSTDTYATSSDASIWHMVSGVYDNGEMRLYVNGELKDTVDTSASFTGISNHANPPGLGSYNSQSSFFNSSRDTVSQGKGRISHAWTSDIPPHIQDLVTLYNMGICSECFLTIGTQESKTVSDATPPRGRIFNF